MDRVYRVCIPHTNRDYFDYRSEHLSPCIGSRVWVPFRKQEKLGIVIGIEQASTTSMLKAISSIIDEQPLLSTELLKLCTWIAGYYQSPLSEVLPLALPKKYRAGYPCQLPMEDCYELNQSLIEAQAIIGTRAHKQLALLNLLAQHEKPLSKSYLTQQGFSSSQILALLHANTITRSEHIISPKPMTQALEPALQLNAEQDDALAIISACLDNYRCFLLQGVTGSGKTEVYLQTIKKILNQNKQVLVLVPEIGLTPQLLSRFTARFDEPMAIIHSNLNESERQIAWQQAAEGRVKIIIGTRAAVFTPMPQLGLIIIDEEHDGSLKQMEGVRYSARDTALMRAHFANIPIILGSATPSLESIYNCQQNKYTLLRLNHKALSSTPLHYQLLDLRAQQLHQGLTSTTVDIIKEHLNQDNQVLVFINRRGFAPVVLCHQCGWMADCKACDSHLTLHKQQGQMICHHCGLTQRAPQSCMQCKSRELIPIGAGTQRIHEYLSSMFPNTAVVRIDRDETRQKHALETHLDKIHSGEAQLIVGTQMLAKGHHFPKLSLVVILDADAGLYNQDFRAIEHLGQLLTQVAGRAGRAEHPGQVLIQTHDPKHPLLCLLIQQGYDAFAKALLSTRLEAQLPPYHFLALVRAQASSTQAVLAFLNQAKSLLKNHQVSTFGPAPAPLARKANQYRMQLLIKSPSRGLLKNALAELRAGLARYKSGTQVRWNVDVDPMDLS